MLKFKNFTKDDDRFDEFFAPYRRGVIYFFSIVTLTVLLPLTISNFISGFYAIGIGSSCLLLIFALNSYYIHLNKKAPITSSVFVLTLIVVITLSLLRNESYGVLWTFPGILLISFSVTIKWSRIYSLIFFTHFTILFFYLLDFQLAVRAFIALLLTFSFLHIFYWSIGRLQLKLVEQSIKDPLTGALNRRQLQSVLAEAFERKKRTKTPATLLAIDLDHFKSINDEYGHLTGDHILKEFVRITKKRCRLLDKIFRTGGEEFLLFLPDTAESGALTVADEIRLIISNANLIENRQITVSIGLSELQTDETVEEWIRSGDEALYTAKQTGRNRVCLRTNLISSDLLQIQK